LDQAKEIIGKTVELEFKLPNPTTGDSAERKALAEKLYEDLSANPEKMEGLTSNRASENIFYTKYDNVGLSELPPLYQTNLAPLTSVATGQLSELIAGDYGNSQYYDANGEIATEMLKGFTFFRIIGTQTGARATTTLSDLIEVATQLSLPYATTLDIQPTDQGIASGTYRITDGTLLYNNGEIYSNQEAYQARILELAPKSTLGLTGEALTAQTEAFHQQVEEIKAALTNDSNATFENVGETMSGMIGLLELKQALPTFDNTLPSLTGTVQTYTDTTSEITYFVKILEKKAPSDKRYGFVKIEQVPPTAFEEALKSKTTYTIEEVFVQDQLTWITAQSSNGKILNGANFNYAAVSNSQMGKPVVVLHFNEGGKEIFCDITEHNIGKQMAIFIGGAMITAPTIQSKICDGQAQIDGQFTPDSARELTNSLNDGALPAPLILMQEEKVSPSLGENAFTGAIIAMLSGLGLIYLYITLSYGFKKGFITLLSLTAFTLVLLAIVKIIDYALSLSGIAAIILSIGMAVDANILIFERMKEEKAEGKNDDTAIKTAYERSRAAIKDAQFSTGLIGLLLFMMGINMFKGFGSMLVVGVVLTLLINVPLIKELLFIFYPTKKEK
jgi:protein-export membrane protein SecD